MRDARDTLHGTLPKVMRMTGCHRARRGHSFLSANEELLARYAACPTSAEVIAVQQAWLAQLQAPPRRTPGAAAQCAGIPAPHKGCARLLCEGSLPAKAYRALPASVRIPLDGVADLARTARCPLCPAKRL